MPKKTYITPAVSILCVFIFFVPEMNEYAQYIKDKPYEVWRLLTSHFAHWTLTHLLWDILAFVTLGTICEKHSTKGFIAILLPTPITLSLLFPIALPELEQYRGISGIDSALLGYFLAIELQRAHTNDKSYALSIIMITGVIIKLCYEFTNPSALFASHLGNGVINVPFVHLTGFILGLIIFYTTTFESITIKKLSLLEN